MTDIVFHLRHIVMDSATRFINGHFGNDAPRPQISIPANEKEDSDLILVGGIKEAADEIERLRAQLASRQSRLPPEFESAIYENLEELYEE